jgi:hypothetical protein
MRWGGGGIALLAKLRFGAVILIVYIIELPERVFAQ